MTDLAQHPERVAQRHMVSYDVIWCHTVSYADRPRTASGARGAASAASSNRARSPTATRSAARRPRRAPRARTRRSGTRAPPSRCSEHTRRTTNGDDDDGRGREEPARHTRARGEGTRVTTKKKTTNNTGRRPETKKPRAREQRTIPAETTTRARVARVVRDLPTRSAPRGAAGRVACGGFFVVVVNKPDHPPCAPATSSMTRRSDDLVGPSGKRMTLDDAR